MNWHRHAAVRGRFYPQGPKELLRALELYCPLADKVSATAVVVPHAGYVYSGAVAGKAYSQAPITDTVFVLCPNHTGRGKRISVWPEGEWETPLGNVPVDVNRASAFLAEVGESDRLAHQYEHAIEVHLPFLQFQNPKVKIVPIVLGGLGLSQCYAVALALTVSAKGCLLVASTDMSHYISRAKAKQLDSEAIEKLEALEPDGLYNVVCDKHISMCGFIPTTVVLRAAIELGATTCRLLQYTDSGAVTGDTDSIVAYASLVIA